MTRCNVMLKTVLVLALVWTSVWAVRVCAESWKNTAARVARTIARADFADWSAASAPPDTTEAKRRDQQLRAIAQQVDALDFQQRDIYRRNRTDATFFNKLSLPEKGLYLDLTVMETFKRFMQSFDGMPPRQRKKFIEQGLKGFAQGGSEEDLARARLGADMLTKIGADGMRAYLAAASADTKLKLAPLIEVVNETMQGLRGNDFGPRHGQGQDP